MHCHICQQGAVGMCRTCFKFYCARHGDSLCQNCREKGWSNAPAPRPMVATAPPPSVMMVAANLPKSDSARLLEALGLPAANNLPTSPPLPKAPPPPSGST
jgi:hypothetical protein